MTDTLSFFRLSTPIPAFPLQGGRRKSAPPEQLRKMKLKNRLYSALLAIAAVAAMAFAQNASAASGAYGSSAATPTIYSKNWWYNVAYPVVGNPPSAATVTVVYYNWDYSYPRSAGFKVYLCNNGGTICGDVTNFGSGSVDFSGYGVPANQSLRLYSGVFGTGTMSPLYGGTTSVTVNYNY